MRFLADECVSGHIVRLLRDRDHDILWIKEIRPGESDEHVLARSFAERRVLLSEDRGFGEHVMRLGRPAFGIVVIAIPGFERSAEAHAEIVAHHLSQLEDRLVGYLTILREDRVRQRHLAETR